MRTLYVETSALLAWLFGQAQGSEARKTIDTADTIVTSALTFVELERVLARGTATGALREGSARRLRGLIESQRTAWIVMAVSENVLARAGRSFPAEPLRTLDAIHLATALAFVGVFPELEVLSFDRRISSNARALGIGPGPVSPAR